MTQPWRDELEPRVDVGIVTIKPEEYTALLERFPERTTWEARQIYECTEVRSERGEAYTVAIVRQVEQGEADAQAVAHHLIEDLRPGWIFLVGIAGGVPADEYTLGDVLIASRLHDFTISALTEDEQQFSNRGGPMHPCVHRLLQPLPGWERMLGGWNAPASIGREKPTVVLPPEPGGAAFYGDESWKRKTWESLARQFPSGLRPRAPKFYPAPVASSNVLVKSSSLIQQWQRGARDLAHVEMELGGVYRAAHRPDGTIFPVLAIRGISDIVGYRRSSEWTEYACHTAAAFTFALLRSGLLPRCTPGGSLARARTSGLDRASTAAGRDITAYAETLRRWVCATSESSWGGRYAPLSARRLDLLQVHLWEPQGGACPPSEPVATTINTHAQWVLMGKGGAGKTTVLFKCALDACEALLNGTGAAIPVFVPLHSLTPAVSILDLIDAAIRRHGLELSADALHAQLEQGHFLLLFDGVNEIPGEAKRVHRDRDLATFLHRYSRARAILTTRREGYDPQVYRLPTVELEPLDRRSIRRFLDLFLPPVAAADLYEKLGVGQDEEWSRRGSMAQLARTPLYLWMLIETYERSKGALPRNRGQLFQRFATFIFGREVGKGSEISPTSRRLLLSSFAWNNLLGGAVVTVDRAVGESDLATGIAELHDKHLVHDIHGAAQVVEEMKRRVFGFVVSVGEQFQWEHQVFQEYFAGLQLRDAGAAGLDAVLETGREQLAVRWLGTLQIAVGLLNGEEARKVVALLADSDPLVAARVWLAADEDVRRATEGAVIDRLRIVALGHDSDLRKAEAAQLIGEIGSAAAFDTLLDVGYGPVVAGVKNVACEWLAALNPRRAAEHAHRQLRDGNRAARIQSVKLLALLSQAGAEDCTWATVALADGNEHVCLMALREITEKKLGMCVPLVLQVLQQSENPNARREAARAVGLMQVRSGVPLLRDAALHDAEQRVRLECITALRRMSGGDAAEALQAVREQTMDSDVRARASSERGRRPNPT